MTTRSSGRQQKEREDKHKSPQTITEYTRQDTQIAACHQAFYHQIKEVVFAYLDGVWVDAEGAIGQHGQEIEVERLVGARILIVLAVLTRRAVAFDVPNEPTQAPCMQSVSIK